MKKYIYITLLYAFSFFYAQCQVNKNDSIVQEKRKLNFIEINLLKSGPLTDIYKQEIKRTNYKSNILRPLTSPEESKLNNFLNNAEQVTAFYDNVNQAINVFRSQCDYIISDSAIYKGLNSTVKLTYKSNILGKAMSTVITPAFTQVFNNYSKQIIYNFYKIDRNRIELEQDVEIFIKKALKDGYILYEDDESGIVNEINRYLDKKRIYLRADFQDVFNTKVVEKIKATELTPIQPQNYNLNNLKSKLKRHTDNLTSSINASYKRLGSDLETLVNNENEINAVVAEWRKQIQKRQVSADSIAKLISSANANQTLLDQYGVLVHKNVIQTNILADYAQRGINFLRDFESYKKRINDVFSGARSVVTDFNKFKDKPTLSGVTTFVQASGNLASNVLNLIGDKEAAKNVGKFIQGFTGAVQIATSIFPPNPIGLIAGLGNILALFGSDQPDPQSEMMKQIAEGFQDMSNKLKGIEAKIDTLTVIVLRSHAETMRSLNFLYKELQFIEKQGLASLKLESLQAYQDFNIMINDFSSFSQSSFIEGFKSLNDWSSRDARSQSILYAIKSLNNDTQSLLDLSRLDLIDPDSIWGQRIDRFDSLVILLKKYYKNDLINQRFLKKVLIPPDSFSIPFLLNLDNVTIQTPQWKEQRLCTEYITSYTDSYIKAIPYQILGRGVEFEIGLTIDDHLQETPQYGNIESRLNKLMVLINTALMQEILLSGHPYIYKMYHSLFTSSDIKEELKAVRNNNYLAMNLTSLILNNHFKKGKMESFLKHYNSFTKTNNVDSLNLIIKSLNSLIDSSTLPYVKFVNNKNILLLQYSQNTTNTLNLPINQTEYIISNKVVYSDAFYQLIGRKQNVISVLYDLKLCDLLSEENKSLLKLLILKNFN